MSKLTDQSHENAKARKSFWLRFGKYCSQTKFHEWILVFVAVGTLIIAFVEFLPKWKKIQDQVQDNKSDTAQLEKAVANSSTDSPPQVQGNNSNQYIVRLASYISRNCKYAEDDIKKFSGLFAIKPEIYYQAKDKLVVVGVPTLATSEADRIVEIAKANAIKFPAESLDRAAVKTNPDWVKITCETVPK